MHYALKTKCEQGIHSNFGGTSNRQEHDKSGEITLATHYRQNILCLCLLVNMLLHILLVFRSLLISCCKIVHLCNQLYWTDQSNWF